ncbi:VOC family protein [Mycolicibacterium wolinskyi]|uniref:Glyoxalase n=1 Tax=Mycolicibacterium wolinskyi TaxID=59750 RepID=A0A1X2FEV6_9MYCO|nr:MULTISPECIES: VOC family protein [Mycolicibacterium]MCV7290592.1 VOC family protein [Mycolicibacterium wolinskyi]MCV7291642.1 VOC family protein [Mycolicibacterium goodii]ORX16917.1 glyoxalase [Mycolicibacterium wolinskyi]
MGFDKSVLPGTVCQIGYVVPDLDDAISGWLQMGVGPWFVIRGLPQRVTFRGEPCAVTLSMALSNSGDLQIELIQQLDDTRSVFTEFLDTTGGGFHQLAYWAPDFDGAMAKLDDAGWPKVWWGGEADGVRFAYFEPPAGAAIVEIMELTDASQGMATFVRQAAARWDGSDPVRELTAG